MMLNSTIDTRVIRQFFDWWQQELAFLIPAFIRRLFTDPVNVIVIQITDHKIQFDYTLGKHKKNLVLDFNETGQLDYQKLLLENPILEKSDRIFRLNKADGLLKILTLPKAVEDNLAQVIGYELDRYTPFSPQQVYYVVTPLSTSVDKITLELILTPKETLDNACKALNAWGIKPLRVDYAGAVTDVNNKARIYNLLPEEKRARKNKWGVIIQSSLIALVFLLISTVIILPVWFYKQSGQTLHTEIKRIKKEAIEVQEIQNKIAVLSEKTNWLIAQKQKIPPLVAIINTISQRLNDETWLKIIEYRDEKLHLTGESPDAAKLINVLETSPIFSEADFESTVTKNKSTGLERFRIMVTVNSKAVSNAE
ncbi:MAG: PilN domain-containing protein [Methylococcales bacterium]|nr:PilN domain-containing protein [Methylococcales bacterium]